MKVLFLATNWPTETSPVDGIFVREHARAAAGHVDVAALYLERAAAEHGPIDIVPLQDEEPRTWRVRYRRLGRPASYAMFMAGAHAAYRRLRREGFEPDVLHAHSFFSALAALLLGRIYQKPVAYTEHWTIFLPENPHRLSRPMRLGARTALNRANVVLPVSAELGRALHALAPQARFRVVPNVVDDALFYPAPQRVGSNGPRLLTAGLLNTGHKGVDLLLEALALLPARNGVRLDVVGDGSLRADYERLARRLELADAVTFHGLKPKRELAALMREADLFVLGSRYENSPCVILEAMASGLPVVATRVGGVTSLVGPESGLLVEPHDPPGLAEGIAAALARLDRFDRTGIAFRARESFGRAAIGRILADVYSKLSAP